MGELVMTSWPARMLLALVLLSTGTSGGVRPLDIAVHSVRTSAAPALLLDAAGPPLPRTRLPPLIARPATT